VNVTSEELAELMKDPDKYREVLRREPIQIIKTDGSLGMMISCGPYLTENDCRYCWEDMADCCALTCAGGELRRVSAQNERLKAHVREMERMMTVRKRRARYILKKKCKQVADLAGARIKLKDLANAGWELVGNISLDPDFAFTNGELVDNFYGALWRAER
jgi:hypothetical protein